MQAQIHAQFKDHVNARIADALSHLDNNPQLALPARVEYMRDLFDDMYIEIGKNVANPANRAPMMAYVESIDQRLVQA